MFKIKSISEMEQELLALSKGTDFIVGNPVKENEQKHLNEKQVKQDVAAFARVLINAYCGWPFHDEIIKRKILKKLISIYNHAHDMTAIDLFNELRPIMEVIPDRHIRIELKQNQARYTTNRKNRMVGRNVAAPNPFVTELRPDNIAVIGFYKMCSEDWVGRQLKKFIPSLKKSAALIVDLRGNGGGSGKYSSKLADFLYGDEVRSFKKLWLRNNVDANKFFQENDNFLWGAKITSSNDPVLHIEEQKVTDFNTNKGYDKPIYILTNGWTGSSAEIFLLRMIHHPRVKVVGDYSGGIEVFGNVGHCYLRNSNIKMFVGMNYRELEFDNFESKGYKPDIRCKDGQDAFEVAMADLNRQKMLSRDETER